MKTYYRDSYGCTASITEHRDGTATLRVSDPYGKRVFRATFKSLRGAKISLGKQSDGWVIVNGPYSYFYG